MYKYRLHYEDGADAGTAEYAVLIKPDETISTGDGLAARKPDEHENGV